VSRFRGGSKAPLAVAGILAAPLFFTALMAFSLRFDKPSEVLGKLGDPTKGTVGTIYLATFAYVGVLLLIGALSMPLRSRLARVVPAGAGIVMTILLLIPLGTWASQHTARYPYGVDNIRGRYNIFLPGEWEHNAELTAHQIGLVTIGIGVAAILISLTLAWRRRHGIEGPPAPPPPPATAMMGNVPTGGPG
jgi:hypothetical protein